MIYRLLFRLVLERLDPETAHALASRALRALFAVPPVRALVRRLCAPGECLRVEALGRTFPSPLGVAAGVDKEATWFDALAAIGFGFVEVGTVTARAQPGNPRPRVARSPRERALVNRMGFPNPGAAAVAARMRSRDGATIVGVNVGKSRAAPLERAVEDYRACVRELAAHADYVVVNVSSPNTPGLRTLQDVTPLRALIEGVRAELGTSTPLLIKIAPDLDDRDVDAIADLALELRLDGIVAVNTTVDHSRVSVAAEGGVSGAPLKRRALAVLERLGARAGGRLVLISVGGIETADDALERIRAGATLVQAYTGFVYGGPGWPRRVNRALARRVRESGCRSIGELRADGDSAAGRAAARSGARGEEEALP